MSAIARITGALMLLMAASASQAQTTLPAMRAVPTVPTVRPLEALVKSVMLSFNDANMTGNYAVFHARLSQPFRQQVSPEKLRENFRQFVEKSIDLDIVAAMQPIYNQPPLIDNDGRLLLKGYFATEPTRVNFEMDFIPADGDWKLLRINVVLGPAP